MFHEGLGDDKRFFLVDDHRLKLRIGLAESDAVAGRSTAQVNEISFTAEINTLHQLDGLPGCRPVMLADHVVIPIGDFVNESGLKR